MNKEQLEKFRGDVAKVIDGLSATTKTLDKSISELDDICMDGRVSDDEMPRLLKVISDLKATSKVKAAVSICEMILTSGCAVMALLAYFKIL